MKNKLMKKALAVVAAGTMCLSLAACGSSSSSVDASGSSAPSETPAASEATSTAPAEGSQTAEAGGSADYSGLTIAMLPKFKGENYFDAVKLGAQEAADEMGITLLYD